MSSNAISAPITRAGAEPAPASSLPSLGHPSLGPRDPAQFVGAHQAGLWRYLRALGCEPARAEEHCQDALLAALNDPIATAPAADAARWLRRAAKNLFLMRLRHERRRPDVASIEAAEADWRAWGALADGGDAALAALDQCLSSLPPRDRELVTRRYADDEPRTTIGRALGLGEAGVKQALRRLRARLRACVSRRLTDGDDNDSERGRGRGR